MVKRIMGVIRGLPLGLSIILLALGLSGCERGGKVQATGDVVRVAYISISKGDEASLEDDVLEGILAANSANPLFGNGDRLEVIYPQSPPNLQTYADTIEQYTRETGISGILLGADSLHTLQMKPTLNQYAIPTLAVVATHPDVTVDTEVIAQLSFDDQRQGQAAAMFARDELLIRRVAVLFEAEDPYSSTLGQIFRTRFEDTGGMVTDFRPVDALDQPALERIRGLETEFLYLPVSARRVFEVVAMLREIDWAPVLMGSDGLLASVIQKQAEKGPELSGMYVTDLFTHADESDHRPAFIEKILGRYDRMFSDETTTDTALGVEAYRTIFDAIEACTDRSDTACVNQSLRSGRRQRGILSGFSIQPDGKARRPIYINTLKNNRLKMVVKVN